MIEIVIDTNVIITAFRSSLGASYRLLQTIEGRLWRPVISPALALEYEAVLKRHASDVGITQTDVDDFVEYICSRSNMAQIYFRWRPELRDPNDDCILELAASRQAAIVTYNGRDFAGAERFGVDVITPLQFLRRIGVL